MQVFHSRFSFKTAAHLNVHGAKKVLLLGTAKVRPTLGQGAPDSRIYLITAWKVTVNVP